MDGVLKGALNDLNNSEESELVILYSIEASYFHVPKEKHHSFSFQKFPNRKVRLG